MWIWVIVALMVVAPFVAVWAFAPDDQPDQGDYIDPAILDDDYTGDSE